mgnify:FL=1
MGWSVKNILLLVLAFPQLLFAQLDHIAIVGGEYPDFGAVPGSWGHMQYYRPYGIKGIVLADWRDLLAVSPLSGEPLNTDRQSWIPLDRGSSVWNQMHPELTAEDDTTSASLLVNYKQGDGEFKDFNLWYHNSLGANTRYGWTSKLRSQPRVLDVTSYDEQRHRLQVNTSGSHYSLRVEGGYDHQINPLYLFEFDTTNFWWSIDDTKQIRSDRWDGNLHLHNLDSNSIGYEIFASFQAGIWNWPAGERQSLNSMAYIGHRFNIGKMSPFEIKLGLLSKQLGGNKSIRQFAEFLLPTMVWRNISGALGLKSLGQNLLFPDLNIRFNYGPLLVKYQTLQVINERSWVPLYETGNLHHISAFYKLSQLDFTLGAWRGFGSGQTVKGYHGKTQFQLPWRMEVSLGAAVVSQPQDWIFASKFFTWQLDQDIILLDGALFSHLKIWGKHYLETQPGVLNAETGLVSNSIILGEDVLHLLNYTISAEVSDVIISFTDSNMLQDDIWSQYANVPWNPSFTLMANQIPETRFRYFSLIWVFNN